MATRPPSEEDLLELQETFNGVHSALQGVSQAYIKFSQAYVKVFDHIEPPQPDPNQPMLDL